jgi:hypothetical protein
MSQSPSGPPETGSRFAKSSARLRSTGGLDSHCRGSPLEGWLNIIRAECRNCRSRPILFPQFAPPYCRSPHTGWPIAARCARIWCVRPVSSRTHNNVVRGSCSTTRKWVTAARPWSVRVDTTVRRTRSRPIGASIVPLSAVGRPSTRARYSRVIRCSRIIRRRALCISSDFATTSNPEVSRSSRCTIPARSGSGPPAARPASAAARVGPRWPGAGWITTPGGLSTTSRQSSSNTTSKVTSPRGTGGPSTSATATESPGASRWFFGRVRPSTVTAPASIRRCAAARDGAAPRVARNASSRTPASPGSAVNAPLSAPPGGPVSAAPRPRTAAPPRRSRCRRRPR